MYHLHYSDCDCAGFKYSSGRNIWVRYFLLIYCAIKEVLASHPAPPFSFVFPHFLIQQISRYGNWTAPLLPSGPSWSAVGLNLHVNPLNPELNPICYLLALLAHHFLHVSRIRVNSLTLRLLMSYIYIYGAPILDVSRSHTTTQHSR